VAKIGLMLGGGGAKGAYQVGVIKALYERKLMNSFKIISGTSIGSINTLLIMTQKNFNNIKDIWEEIDSSKVFQEKHSFFGKEKRVFNLDPLAKTLFDKISVDKIKNSKYQGYATAALMEGKVTMLHQIKTDTMQKEVFHLNTTKEPREAVLASSSMPIIFGPTTVLGKNYVDGGVLDNYPVQPLIDEGCNIIFSIPLDNRFNPYLYDHLDINIINFTAPQVFEGTVIKDVLDALKFNSEFKEEKEALGYYTANLMIDKLYNLGIIKNFLGFKRIKKLNDFQVISLSKAEQLLLKNVKID